ncbi:GntR family transcriptional regulator [Dethiobacter alkaliphilus]|uniref:Transcriptional regulator, GntR family n=1 Tax=Dethiobacter alkaliphilus AHT 1 TaxID=555088 RepID=C0GL00_DETAL|nr:GntR family transcriptional regulator [Dethiobacter alkaliphilus]EEG75987.1 transcriptional regulator, GntR family [Dethiobacter alkaliphilus AHT 1]
MKINADGMTPIYVQIAQWLETEILTGSLAQEEKVYSQYQLAEMYNINPATAAKGLKILADEGILYKKRGLGMFVSPNAQQMIQEKRKNETLRHLVVDLVLEAERLGIDDDELTDIIRQVRSESRGDA